MVTITREQWLRGYEVARIWWCEDEVCDCTQPVIELVTPNRRQGYPWVFRTNVWEGRFLTDTWEYTAQQRDELQYAPLREACAQRGVAVPEQARPGFSQAGEAP